MINDLNQLLDTLRTELKPRRTIPLDSGELAVQTVHGFWLVVPSWNLDVAIGIIRDGQIEPWTNRVMLEYLRPGHTVVNVGANFGYYAALAAQRVGYGGCVHAVEANPVVFPFLVKGMFWSGFPNIIRAYHFAAVGAEDNGKAVTLSFDPQFIGGGNLFSRASLQQDYRKNKWNETNIGHVLDDKRMFIPRGLYTDAEVPGVSLDSVLEGPVDLMLIDAEGSECFVIDGACDIVASSPGLTLIMEWDPNSYRTGEVRRPLIDAMWDFLLEEQGFSVSRICPELFNPLSGQAHVKPLDRQALFSIPHSDLLLQRR